MPFDHMGSVDEVQMALWNRAAFSFMEGDDHTAL